MRYSAEARAKNRKQVRSFLVHGNVIAAGIMVVFGLAAALRGQEGGGGQFVLAACMLATAAAVAFNNRDAMFGIAFGNAVLIVAWYGITGKVGATAGSILSLAAIVYLLAVTKDRDGELKQQSSPPH